ncbi:Zinc finger protein [Armadillidium vulgare]|nr:Zinc finger protein [Armadillidium vulgare]
MTDKPKIMKSLKFEKLQYQHEDSVGIDVRNCRTDMNLEETIEECLHLEEQFIFLKSCHLLTASPQFGSWIMKMESENIDIVYENDHELSHSDFAFKSKYSELAIKTVSKDNLKKQTNKDEVFQPLFNEYPENSSVGHSKEALLVNRTNLKLFRCSECKFKSISEDVVELHSFKHIDKASSLFRCSQCTFVCDSDSNMCVHMLNHIDNKMKLLKCQLCDYESCFKERFENHMNMHSKLMFYECSDCSFKCKYKRELKSHFLMHSNAKMEECPKYDIVEDDNLKFGILNSDFSYI